MNGKIIAKRVVSMFVSDKGNLRLILLGTPSSVHVEIFILPITVANTRARSKKITSHGLFCGGHHNPFLRTTIL